MDNWSQNEKFRWAVSRCLYMLIYHNPAYMRNVFKLFAGSCERLQAKKLFC